MQVPGQVIANSIHTVGNNGQAFIERPWKTVSAPIDFAIVVGWKAIIKAILSSWLTSVIACASCLAQTL